MNAANVYRMAVHRFWTAIFVAGCMALLSVHTRAADSQEPSSGESIQSRGLKHLQPPTWPQKWQLNNREPAGFGFGVTRPGPVTVDIQSQGAPVVVELYGPAPQAVQRQTGSGVIRLAYQVTPADVQRSALWHVRIALAQSGGPPAQAAGTISVQHPPADANVMRAQMQASMAQRRAIDPQTAAAMKAKMDASFQAVMAKFQQEEAARRAAVAAEGKSRPLIAGAAPSGQIMPRGVEDASAAAKDQGAISEGDVSSRALLPPRELSPRAKMFSPLPPPYIIGFSQYQALPGDRISIQGTGFLDSAPGGQVLVILKSAAGDVPYGAPVQTWSDTQIDINVPPNISGIANVTNADVVVVRGQDQRRSDPRNDYGGYFRVAPAMELRALPLPPPVGESIVYAPPVEATPLNLPVYDPSGVNVGQAGELSNWPPGWGVYWYAPDTPAVATRMADLFGFKGNDTFFKNKRLINNWKVSSVEAIHLVSWCVGMSIVGTGPNLANAYVAESRVGTNSPYLNVRVWMQPLCGLTYTIRISIVGPKGVPYE
jgi:hypothetical protein